MIYSTLICSVMLLLFWGYHFYLTIINKTTNETFKYGDLQDEMNYLKHNPEISAEIEKKLKPWQLKRRTKLLEMIKTGKKIKNKYDKGFKQNIMEVISPPSAKKSKFS